MNTGNDIHEHGDRALQQLQRQAVAALSSQTLAQLRQRRPRASDAGAQRSRHRRWWLASACSALLAIVAALNFNTLMPAHTPVGGDRASLAIASDDEALLLDENPELYLWLGSETTLAME